MRKIKENKNVNIKNKGYVSRRSKKKRSRKKDKNKKLGFRNKELKKRKDN